MPSPRLPAISNLGSLFGSLVVVEPSSGPVTHAPTIPAGAPPLSLPPSPRRRRTKTSNAQSNARRKVAEAANRWPRKAGDLPECLAAACADWPAPILWQWVEVQLCYRNLAKENVRLAEELEDSRAHEMSDAVRDELEELRQAVKDEEKAARQREERFQKVRVAWDKEMKLRAKLDKDLQKLQTELERAKLKLRFVPSMVPNSKHPTASGSPKGPMVAEVLSEQRVVAPREPQRAWRSKHFARLQVTFESEREELERAHAMRLENAAAHILQRYQRARRIAEAARVVREAAGLAARMHHAP